MIGRPQAQMRCQQIQHRIVTAHNHRRLPNEVGRLKERDLERSAAIDAFVKARDMRQAIGTHQRSDDAGAALQRRRLQLTVDLRQRHANEIVIADRGGNLARRNRLHGRYRRRLQT